MSEPDQLELLDSTFPHDKPQMLYWNVQSEIDGEAAIEITYFTSGISWSADYLCIANAEETQMSLEGFVRVHNNSGEEYEDARVRLVVGQINLVEKIAQLAQVPMPQVAALEEDKRQELRLRAMRETLGLASKVAADAPQAAAPAEKQVIKEGLSEYFLYTIEGTETIPNGWSKRLRSLQAQETPFRIEYRYRQPEYGDQLVRLYLLSNDKASGLGETPLPDGVVRVFRDKRPRRAQLPGRPRGQVHPHRRQDRAESRPRSGRDFRPAKAPSLAGQRVDAAQRRRCLPPRG